jgi:hypothetical protein
MNHHLPLCSLNQALQCTAVMAGLLGAMESVGIRADLKLICWLVYLPENRKNHGY